MKIILSLLAVAIVAGLVCIGWSFQPWMRPGSAVQISSEHFEDYDFQVWQRKNSEVAEPFATGLFIHKQGEQWQVVLLDFQDTYRPHITFQNEKSEIIVFRGNKKLGVFDKTRQGFKRESDEAFSPSIILSNAPPDNWWLK